MRATRTLALLSCAAALDGYATATLAAEPAYDTLTEVVVTARRRAEDLQKVPVSIVAFSGEQLKRQGVMVSNDLQFSVPGLTATGVIGSRENPPLTLRAQGQSFGGALPAVQSYLGEVPIPGSMSTLYDLSSVQVVKGPQGTLFGRNTTGGAILYTPARPAPDFDGYVALKAGNLGYRELEGAVNLPLGPKAALRISGDRLRRDGYTHDLTTGAMLDDQHRDDVRVQLALEPAAGLNSTFMFTGSRVRQNGSSSILYSVPAGGLLASPMFAGLWRMPDFLAQQQANGNRTTWSVPGNPNYYDRDFWLVSNVTEATFGGLKLKNIVGYQESRTDFRVNLSGAPTPTLFQGGQVSSTPVPPRAAWASSARRRSWAASRLAKS